MAKSGWVFSLLLLCASMGIATQAQELPDAPQSARAAYLDNPGTAPVVAVAMSGKPRTWAPPAHRFFDRISMLSTGMETAGLLADGVTTQDRLGQTYTRYSTVNGVVMATQVRITEVDPIGKLFVNSGWPGQIAGGAATIGADLGVRYWLHRTNHHRLERLVPFMITASNAFAAIHNSRLK